MHFTEERIDTFCLPITTNVRSQVDVTTLRHRGSSPRFSSPTPSEDRERLRVAIIGINYAPETTGIAPYTAGLARGLAARGHRVEVLTGQPHYPQWRRLGGYPEFRSVEDLDGVRVRRFRHYIPLRQSARRRALMELTFGLQAALSRWTRPDVVICISPPLVASAMCAARLRFAPRHRPALGVLVHDVYSRAMTEIGVPDCVSITTVRRLESFLTRNANGVAVIHAGFASDLVDELSVDARRIREIRNWTHVPAPDPLASASYRRSAGWGSDDIIALHAGNMGIKQGLENVIAAARLAEQDDRNIRFVLLGDGHQRERLEREADGVSNLQILDPVPDALFPTVLGAADVLLVNELPGVAHMAMPSKLTSYFRSGKPVLAACDDGGFTAGEIALSGAGVRVPAGRPDLLLDEAFALGRDRELASRLGAAGAHYSDSVLSADAALDQYERWIHDLASSRDRGSLRMRRNQA